MPVADLPREAAASLPLRRMIRVVGEAADGSEAVEQAIRTGPDVVVMDVRMPGVDGLEATRRIAARMPAVRVP